MQEKNVTLETTQTLVCPSTWTICTFWAQHAEWREIELKRLESPEAKEAKEALEAIGQKHATESTAACRIRTDEASPTEGAGRTE